jgi:hypothetical protein
MQPYLFPYRGYFSLIKASDIFVLHDDVQWIKGGWINRNRILNGDSDELITLSVKKRSSHDNINLFTISNDNRNRDKYLAKIKNRYKNAPFFMVVYPIIEDILYLETDNLSEMIRYSLFSISSYLKLDCTIVESSKIKKNDDLSGQDRVIEICKQSGSSKYINPLGGEKLYERQVFRDNNIVLEFMKLLPVTYEQFGGGFVDSLSIIDLMMFCDKELINRILSEYSLV